MVVNVKLMSMFAKHLKNYPDGRVDVKEGATFYCCSSGKPNGGERLSNSDGQTPIPTVNNSFLRFA